MADYHFEMSGAECFAAANYAQEFRARIDAQGIRVDSTSRAVCGATPAAAPAEWTVTLCTIAFGRRDRTSPVESPRWAAHGVRAEADRGVIVEWVENDSRGLEQGWHIESPPPAPLRDCESPPAQPLWIELAFTGTLAPRITEDHRAILLVDAQGIPRLRYHGLAAWDADGIELDAALDTRGGAVGIRIDDHGARYPITVDPILGSAIWTAESDQESAALGSSVSTAGDVNGDGYSDVIVGASFYDGGETDEGRAYVHYGAASTLATLADWTVESDFAGAGFGHAVATAGDVNADGFDDVIVGAPGYGAGLEGRAYLFLGSALGLEATASWIVDGEQAGAAFGTSVSTAGDVNGDGFADVVVGATGIDNGETGEGRVYLFLGSATGPATTADWTAESNQANADYGDVAAAGDVNGDGYDDVIVGARLYDNGTFDEGSVFLYLGSPTGPATAADWIADSNQGACGFGRQVAGAGDVNGDGYADLLVAAHQYDNGQTNEGRVFLYFGAATVPATTANWTAESNQTSALFAAAIGTAGDVNGDGYADVIVGATDFDNGNFGEGAAYVYFGSPAGPSSSADWSAEGEQDVAAFGSAVLTAGDVNGDGFSDLLIGASGFDNDEIDEGRAFVYLGAGDPPATTAAWSVEGAATDEMLGAAVSWADDVNGDGFSDLIVGVPGYTNGHLGEGAAFLYLGSAAGLELLPAWTAEGDALGAAFGTSVSGAGDVNGDGYSDVIVGAPLFGNGEATEGRASIYLGSAGGLVATPEWVVESGVAFAKFGGAVAQAGDVNGDGYGDVLVGASGHANSFLGEGRAFLFLGSAAGPASAADWTVDGAQASAKLGAALASAGDVNGDGYTDVIVGAPDHSGGEAGEGRAYLFLGGASGLAALAAWSAESDQIGARFGVAVDAAGDVNGDGFGDVIIGADLYDNGDVDEGRAFLYLGGSLGLGASEAATAEGNTATARFGAAVAGAGDTNGDGLGDVTIGASDLDNGEIDEGRAYVFLGSATGIAPASAWEVEANLSGAHFGASVAGGGDANGDGFQDVAAGAPNAIATGVNEGALFVYFGSAGGGAVRAPRQRRADDLAPIARYGRTDSTASFRVAATAHNPAGVASTAAGRATIVFESEVEEYGTLFDGAGLNSGAPQDSGAPGGTLEISAALGGLSPSNAYRWRARFASDNPFFPHSPWFALAGKGGTAFTLRTGPDCNGNEIDDRLDLAGGVSLDCNGNDMPDECDIAGGFSVDCNDNGVPDSCDLGSGASLDCNANVVPDECDIASGESEDCNANAVPDECDIALGTPDCNANGVPDPCDIASGSSADLNENALPDECDKQLIRADSNVDGAVNVADPIYSLSYLFADGPTNCFDSHDANDDGQADLADPIFSLGYLFFGGPLPAAPFPFCGIDPTVDQQGSDLGCESFDLCP